MVLVRAGYGFSEVARRLGVHRKTVSIHAKKAGLKEDKNSKVPTSEGVATGEIQNCQGWPPAIGGGSAEKKPPVTTCSACEPYRIWIEEQVRLRRNAMSIWQEMVDRNGFTHRYNSVKRFVNKLKIKDPEQFDRLEFLPGEEAQVDYGEGALTRYPNTGKYRRPRLFVMTLKYSRRSFRKVVWKSSQEIWAKLHEEAFRYFGGCPQYVVLDNLKEGVIKPDIYEPELNPLYAAVLRHYGVVADPARVRDPNRKGTVESAIQHTQDTCLKGLKFETIEEQNKHLMHWEERWASQRIHGRTKRQVEEMFQEEKPHLKALPIRSFQYFKQEIRTVWDDGCVQVGNCYYAARPAPLYSKIVVRIYDHEIEIIDPRTLEVIRRHPKLSRPGQVAMEESDRVFNPTRQTEMLLSRAGMIGPRTRELCENWFKKDGRMGQRRMYGIVNLAKKYPAKIIEKGTTIAVEKGIRSTHSIRNLIEKLMEERESENEISLIQNHDLIRSPSEYGSFWNLHTGDRTMH